MGKTSLTHGGKPVYRAKNGTYYVKMGDGKAKFIKAPQGARKKSAPKKKAGVKKKSQSKVKHMKTSTIRRARQIGVGGGILAIPAARTVRVFEATNGDMAKTALAIPQMIAGVDTGGNPNAEVKAVRKKAAIVGGGVVLADILLSKAGAYKHLGNLYK